MDFGCGVLIDTLTFSILVEASEVTNTLPATATGLFLGGISFSIANLILERKSKRLSSKNRHLAASDDKNTAAVSKPSSGKTLFIGAVMDNIPDNAALGVTLAEEDH
jgi:zinc transporter, ZIP family